MIACFALCWLGVGLVLGASPARSKAALRSSAALAPPVLWLLRALGVSCWGAATWVLRAQVPSALLPIAVLLALTAAASMASLLAPLRPRLYASTVPASALLAVFGLLAG